MKRVYVFYFTLGGVESSDTVTADSFTDACEMFKCASIHTVTTHPGRVMRPDSKPEKQVEREAKLLEKWADGWHGGLADLMRKEVDRLRSQARLTETQQAAQRILGESDG